MDKNTGDQKMYINFPQIQLIILEVDFKLTEPNFWASNFKKVKGKEKFSY